MKKINILLLGAHINSSNLGCQALTYSLVNLLEIISKKNNVDFRYYVLEYQPNPNVTKKFKNNIMISNNEINSYQFPFMVTWKNKIKNIKYIIDFRKILKDINVAIDVTAGDSFSDIYGDWRFKATSLVKEIVEKNNIPLILAPQTYGPFNKKKNEKYAAKIINDAYKVITRDTYSAEYVKNISNRNIEVTTDLAFQLPFEKDNSKKNNEKNKIGINISGLLVKNNVEKGFVNKSSLTTNYDEYIEKLLDELNKIKKYEVYLIPHVEEDYFACEEFNKKYPNTVLVNNFENPIKAKSFISNMDIFIGARMHATIAAFTSGVVTIPTAYSRKFETLFSLVDYNVLIDLQKMTTEEALKKTLEYINNYTIIKEQLNKSLIISDKYKNKTLEFFEEAILNLGDFDE